MTNLTKSGLIVLAATALLAQSTKAQGVWNQDDLILGVRATGGTGASLNYEIDLGSVLSLGPGATTFNSHIGSDLSTVFGANWLTRSDLFWSVSAVQYTTGGTDPRFTTYFTQPLLASPGAYGQAALATPAGHVNSQVSALNGGFRSTDFLVGPAGGVSAPGAGTVSASLANSYSSQVVGVNSTSYSSFPFGEANPNTALDFYRFAPSDTSRLLQTGMFSFDANGGFHFDAIVVPEPTTSVLGGMALLLVAFRRQLKRSA